MFPNMRVRELFNRRVVVAENVFADLRVWIAPEPVRGSGHRYKYSLALVVNGVCELRYDNEPGKGDHRHWGEPEFPYAFTSPAQLAADFWDDVKRWQDENSNI